MDSLRRIDADAFKRAHDLFEAKRGRLAPDSVERLACEVVERLAVARDADPSDCLVDLTPATDPALVDAFCDVLLGPDSVRALEFVKQELAPAGADVTMLHRYIGEASRRLGSRWETDDVTFVEVTMAVGKLYALVRSIGTRRPRSPAIRETLKTAIFASVPGEQHTLGVTIAAEHFRDAGWDIDLQIDRTHDDLLARAELLKPSVVGLSLGGETGLAALTRLVVALRLTQPDIVIAVATVAQGMAEAVSNLVDLDLIITDAQQAEVELSRILGL